MALHLGTKKISEMYLGTSKVSEMYLGEHKIFGGKDNRLRFTAEQANSSFGIRTKGTPVGHIEYSLDNGSTWSNLTTSVTLGNVGDYALIRGVGGAVSSSTGIYTQFTMNGKIAVSGSISDISPISDFCYYYLFADCRVLTKAPELPATTLANSCYKSMFTGCTSLTEAPELPATTLSRACYQSMFNGCTSLTEAPELPATALVLYCYEGMFSGCTNLSSIKAHFSSWSPDGTTLWVSGVSSSGTFVCPSELSDDRGSSKIPSGWTKVNL